MGEKWLHPVESSARPTTVTERGLLLVDLLHLVDALPPRPRRELEAPTFEELCERR